MFQRTSCILDGQTMRCMSQVGLVVPGPAPADPVSRVIGDATSKNDHGTMARSRHLHATPHTTKQATDQKTRQFEAEAEAEAEADSPTPSEPALVSVIEDGPSRRQQLARDFITTMQEIDQDAFEAPKDQHAFRAYGQILQKHVEFIDCSARRCEQERMKLMADTMQAHDAVQERADELVCGQSPRSSVCNALSQWSINLCVLIAAISPGSFRHSCRVTNNIPPELGEVAQSLQDVAGSFM